MTSCPLPCLFMQINYVADCYRIRFVYNFLFRSFFSYTFLYILIYCMIDRQRHGVRSCVATHRTAFFAGVRIGDREAKEAS